jgi:predicted cupin superfamily sugar epimerase
MLCPDGGDAIATVGSDLRSDMRPQLLIPEGTFHTSRLKPGAAGWALLGSTE